MGARQYDSVRDTGRLSGPAAHHASGGEAESVTEIDATRGETVHYLPQRLPDGDRFLYFVSSANPEVQGLYVGSLDRQQPAGRVLATNRKALYAPPHDGAPGALVWVQTGSLVAQPFDASTLTLEGDVITIADSVAVSQWNTASFWLSDTGVLAYMSGGRGNKARLFRRSRDGTRLEQISQEEQIGSFFLSPDGTRLAIDRLGAAGTYDSWIYEFRRQIMTKQTFDPRGDFLPQWSPDGQRIVFTSNRTGIAQLYVTAAGGGGAEEVLTTGPDNRSLQWTRDNRYILYANRDPRTQMDLWALPLEEGRPPFPVVQTPFDEPTGQVSPDGNWIAYESNESGRPEVYLQRFPPAGGKIPVSSRGGTRPKWRSDGKELYFLSGDALMSTPLTITLDGIQSEAAVPLFSFTMPTQWNVTYPYEVTLDGQEFFVLEASAEPDVPLVVISGWQARLKR